MNTTSAERSFVSLRITRRRRRSEQFEAVVDEVAAENIFSLLKDGLQRLLEMRGIIGKADHAHLGTLPGVVVIEFGDGYVEAGAETVFQAAQNLAFVLQGVRFGDVDFEGQ